MALNLTMMIALMLGGIVSFLSAFLVMKWRVMDYPNTRSSHTCPTPKAGGLGVMLGTLLPIMFSFFLGDFGPYAIAVFTLVIVAIFTGLLGLYDDFYELSAKLKLPLLGVVAVFAGINIYPVSIFALDHSQITIPLLAAYFGTALWVFVLGNAANFMDGSDGLVVIGAGLSAIIMVLLAVSAGNDLAGLLALALLAALIGFGPLNAPPARLFLGDTGALFIGFWLAGLSLIYIHEGPPGAVYAVVLVFMPWLSDVLLTLAWRAHKRMDLLRSHKDHIYQLMLQRGATHGTVATILAVQTVICGALAWVFRNSATSELLALIAMATLAIIGHWWARKWFEVTNPAFVDSASGPTR